MIKGNQNGPGPKIIIFSPIWYKCIFFIEFHRKFLSEVFQQNTFSSSCIPDIRVLWDNRDHCSKFLIFILRPIFLGTIRDHCSKFLFFILRFILMGSSFYIGPTTCTWLMWKWMKWFFWNTGRFKTSCINNQASSTGIGEPLVHSVIKYKDLTV